MNKGLAVISVACLIFGFQNCSPNQLQSQIDAAESGTNIYPVGAGASENVESESYSSIQVFKNAASGKASESYSNSNFRYIVNVSNGQISYVDDTNAVIAVRCLSAEQTEILNLSVRSVFVCEDQIEHEDVCAQKYTAPSASISDGTNSVNLGESFDACGKGRKSLCGSGAANVNALITKVADSFDTLSACGN